MSRREPEAWIVDDDEAIRWVLERALQHADIRVRGFEDPDTFRTALADSQPDVVITDIRMPGFDGLDLLSMLRREHPKLPVIVITAHSDLETAVAAYQGGAFEYLPKPFDVDQAVELVRRAATADGSAERDSRGLEIPSLIGQAPAMQEVFRAIGRLSRSSMNVLITGESGTGKELVAQALHEHSPRSEASFVAINTAAIPAELLESELFGHERGAFTGAEARREGRFEQANEGTLFLDEIGDMSMDLQTRLLRVLGEGEFYRVGGRVPIQVDVRVIAATHRDLENRVAAGTFREDLFHRLDVMRIEMPPLRDRHEDVPLLLTHYLARAAAELEVAPKQLGPGVESSLVAWHWPGNVRELVNVCRRMTVTAPGREIRMDDLPRELRSQPSGSVPSSPGDWPTALAAWATEALESGAEPLLPTALPEFERALIRTAMAAAGGQRQQAARLLGWGRNTLTRKIKELGLSDL
jgi:two-component system nitrogen regulation response regulator GlnG